MYRLRDERGVFSDIWASGLMRRAALAAGRRLAAKGRIRDAEPLRRRRLRRDVRASARGGRAFRGRTRGARSNTARRIGPRTPRRCSALRRRRLRTCPGCRRRKRV